MKFITDYKEFDGDSGKSVLAHISTSAIDNKDKVLSYLKNGKDDGVRCSGVYDYVKDEPNLDTVRLFTDGEYFWDSEEIYHFEKYNMALNGDFIHKVLST
jgi:hypothetical protein